MKISRAVREGHLVVKRGHKYVRASKRDKPERLVGVYQRYFRQVIQPIDDGPMQYIDAPEGIVVGGAVRMLTDRARRADAA